MFQKPADNTFYEDDSDQQSEQMFIDIEVHCSKGTYIRSLCEDIGQAIGCGAHISALRRLESAPFSLSQSIALNSLTENFGLYTELADADKARMDK